MKQNFLVLLALFFLPWSGNTAGQQEDLTRFLNSQANKDLLYERWVSQRKMMCDSKEMPKKAEPRNFFNYAGFSFPQDAKFPVAGFWVESWNSRMCGRDVILNFVCQGQNVGEPKCQNLMPGATNADFILQGSVMPFLLASFVAAAKSKDCQKPIALNSVLI